jgi:hypothetical protein
MKDEEEGGIIVLVLVVIGVVAVIGWFAHRL